MLSDPALPLTLARFGLDVAAVLTVGFLLTALLVPARAGGTLSGTSVRALRAGARTAGGWCVAALATLLLTSWEVSGLPLVEALAPGVLGTVALDFAQGRALLIVAVGALLLAAAARLVLTVSGAALLLLGALVVLLPPALTGHSAGGADHDLAVTSLGLHLVAAALWVGGLGALVLLRMRKAEQLSAAVARFSPVALACFVVVGLSGVVNAWVALGDPADLVGTTYGLLLVAKTLALIVLGAIGWWHRRSTLPALTGSGGAAASAAFRRFATVEAAVMVATVGVAVVLSRTPPPVGDSTVAADPTVALLGFPMPPPFSVGALVTEARPGLAFVALAAALGLLYARGLRGLRRRGDRWPVGRSIAWFAGLAVLVLATSSGLNPYGRVLFSVHMVQHMLLAMVVPLCLVLGAPVTLALRALPARGGSYDLRDVVLAAVHSRLARVLANPLVALAIFVVSLYGTYYTGLYEYGLRSHVGHVLMHLHFIAAGYIFYSMLIGSDPAPSRPPYLFRIVVLFAGMVFHAFFGVAVMESGTLLAADWYAALDRPWGPTPLADQAIGGSIAWSFGEIPTLGVLGALFVQWVRADEREARRSDRRAERTQGTDEDELEAYNRYLAELGSRAEAQRARGTRR